MNTKFYDIAIVGGGIVGLATALALKARFPRYSLTVLEKESEVAHHQTGHNSGVIHAGIYYKPGSYKAKLCIEGARLMLEFCRENSVPYDRCGKLIVATTAEELPRLHNLYERGRANGIAGLELIDPERAREIEPHTNAVQAIYSPDTAITDFGQVAAAMARNIRNTGGEILLSSRVLGIRGTGGDYHLETAGADIRCRRLINCAGLHADRVARMMGLHPEILLLPFRGEYYTLGPECRLVRNLIYPVADPQFPFLGVHFTKKIDGGYEAGPNAVLAFAREGYRFGNVCWKDLAAMFTHPGFWAMAWRYWHIQAYELYRSLSRRAFLNALQKLVPELQDRDLARGGSGVRAQVVTREGLLADDFIIVESHNAINVLNAPSPAATASIAIGNYIADLAAKHFE
ncbi:MAG: L-2-hydroxyglutarate oxidase [Acidobacteria bacterium]|nr:L-2-hydroxyglutarate oxidase [Acidobacteriota bacterium]